MTFRLLTTPLAAPVAWPTPRNGGIAPALLDAFVAAPGARASLDRLRDPRVLVVTTGQQPGLLTGPLYTIHKALSAVALARQCEHRWNRPVVPVFWAAGGDHDFAEGNHAAWTAADGSTITATLRERPADAPLTPLYREPVGPEIGPVLERLAADLAGSPHGAEVLALFRRWYRPESNLADACAQTIAELLAPYGIVVFDAVHPAVKRAQVPYLVRALEQAAVLEQALVGRQAALAAQGHDAGVTVGDGATLVMFEGTQGRDRLAFRAPGFMTRRSHEQLSLADVEQLAATDPGRFSPNVLLRPAIESAILPTVAYMGGPGELRYWALAEAIYAPLGVAPQRPLPRWSGLIVDARTDRVLEKFGATLDELLAPGLQLEGRVIREQLPADARDALASLRAAIERDYAVLTRAAVAIDPTIEKTLQNLRNQAFAGTQEAEKRLVNHLKKRQVTETQQIARARELVLPLGRPQERVLTLAPLLARHGPALLDALAAHVEAWYAAALEAAPAPR
ncbi:MAG: bacillithiol biosynthesis cysteine-adding enzyme BshC [Gemmatimonadales bacterium]|nr:bacillithiol biosynthesis cysteine-adding enzyme BshC [Gemmatimonadales bacterium]